MENPTEFNVEDALRKWSEELAAQPGLTSDSRKELEAHVRDTVKELCAKGLNEEESFWLACRRVGPPRQLGEEFAKGGSSLAWKMRVLGVAAALMGMLLIQDVFMGICGALGTYELHGLSQTPAQMVRSDLRQIQASKALSGRSKPRLGGPPTMAGRDGLISARSKPWQILPPPAPWQIDLPILWRTDALRSVFGHMASEYVIGVLIVIFLTARFASRSALAHGRLCRFLFDSRWRFMMIGTLAVLAFSGLDYWGRAVNQGPFLDPDEFIFLLPLQAASAKFVLSAMLVFFMGLLIPSRRKGWLLEPAS